MKKSSAITTRRVEHELKTQLNPVRNLTPQTLGHILEDYRRGDLARPSLLFDRIQARDDMLATVAPRRKQSIAARRWDVVIKPGIAGTGQGRRAERHKRALEFALNNICATHAIKSDYRRSWGGVVRNLLEAVASGWSVNEMIWKFFPGSRGGVTTDFRFVPLHYFEARTGPLRFKQSSHARDGIAMDESGWIVTVDDGLMEASAITYLYKTMPLRDWVIHSERAGFGGIIGRTNAKPGTKEYTDACNAVAQFMNDFHCVITGDLQFEFPKSGGAGNAGANSLPYPPLVNRCDRVLSALWRGGDLASLSNQTSEAGQGASMQGDEKQIILYGDKMTIEDTLNAKWVPWVIRYAVGDELPLVELQIPLPDTREVEAELKTDQLLIDAGVFLSEADLRRRYNRPAPENQSDRVGNEPEIDENLSAELRAARETLEREGGPEGLSEQQRLARAERSPQVPLPNESPRPEPPSRGLRNVLRSITERFVRRNPTAEALSNRIEPEELQDFLFLARFEVEAARVRDLQNLHLLFAEALEEDDPAALRAALEDIDRDLPDYVGDTANQESAFQRILTTALVNGFGDLEDDNPNPENLV